jgi:hypothetical protein
LSINTNKKGYWEDVTLEEHLEMMPCIDTHHPIFPPEDIAAVGDKAITAGPPNGASPKWDIAGTFGKLHPEKALEDSLLELKRLYFDTAITVNPVSSPVLLRFAPVDHVLFGTDFLFAPEIMMHKTIEGLQQMGLCHDEVRMIEGENAQSLLSLV